MYTPWTIVFAILAFVGTSGAALFCLLFFRERRKSDQLHFIAERLRQIVEELRRKIRFQDQAIYELFSRHAEEQLYDALARGPLAHGWVFKSPASGVRAVAHILDNPVDAYGGLPLHGPQFFLDVEGDPASPEAWTLSFYFAPNVSIMGSRAKGMGEHTVVFLFPRLDASRRSLEVKVHLTTPLL